MLFNSPLYFVLFLPFVLAVFFLLGRIRFFRLSLPFLSISSLLFYGWWKPGYLWIILASMLVNFIAARAIDFFAVGMRRICFYAGLLFNILLLGYYKYAGFIIENLNSVITDTGLSDKSFTVPEIILPLAISFFTFQQIAFLVDTYKGKSKRYSLVDYILFVCFFPQLIAGPIVHHNEIMPQLFRLRTKLFSWRNFNYGLCFFAIGLFKKVVIADHLAVAADRGFSGYDQLTLIDGWVCTLSYTFQLYFDFSGYCDMAIGSARMLNIHLPINFSSPYKAHNIQDFWRRWHITLSRWLRDYIYIPLGGNRCSKTREFVNLVVTFLIGGIWHGAGWTFVLWGLFHGIGVGLHRFWHEKKVKIPHPLKIAVTFSVVHLLWVLFRAESCNQAIKIYRSMLGLNGFMLPDNYIKGIKSFTGVDLADWTYAVSDWNQIYGWQNLLVIPLIMVVAFILPNSQQVVLKFRHGLLKSLLFAVILIVAVYYALISDDSPFLYFNF